MSVLAKLLVPVLRFQVKRKLRGNPDVRRIRAALGVAVFPAPPGVVIRPATLGGVAGEWVARKTGSASDPVLLYIHGGAFVACSPRTHRPATGALAKRGFRVFVPDYRLAPEHPFPAALDDAEAVYRALLASGTPASRIVLAGESAGGNLVLALLLRLRQTGGPSPAAAAAWSPATDLTGASPSFVDNEAKDAMLTEGLARGVPGYYLPAGHDPADPLASVVFGDFSGQPPLLVHVGADEMLRDDAIRVAEKARADGVQVELKVWPDVPHAWQLFPILPEARQSVGETASFLRRFAV